MTGRAERSPLTEKLELAARTIRSVKEQHVATRMKGKRTRAGADLYPTVQAFRGEESVAILTPFKVSRDAALRAAHAAAVGFGADTLAVSTDGWMVAPEHVDRNPLTGRPWASGDAQDAVENHRGLETGLIIETLSTIVVNRAGDSAGRVQTYRLLPVENATPRIVGWRVEWFDALAGRVPEDARDAGQWTGIVPDALVAAMQAAPLDVIVHRAGFIAEEFGISAEAARAHMDAAVVKTLPEVGFEGAVLLTSDSPERTAVLDESLGGDRG